MAAAPDPELKASLDKAEKEISASRRCIAPPLPRQLHHYTTAAGLLGILDSSSLGATNCRYLNDASEVQYALNLFAEVAASRMSAVRDEFGRAFLVEAPEVLERRATEWGDLYVSCFCEDDDLLNQWRVYAGAGGGFSLAFSGDGLTPDMPVDPDLYSYSFRTLRKVQYDPVIQRNCLEQVVDCVLKAVRNLSPETRQRQGRSLLANCFYFLHTQVAEYLACFKNPAFAPENEWRLCQHVDGQHIPDDVRFRSGPFGVTPYLALNLSEKRLPIEAVRLGPTTNPEGTRYAISQLLKSRGYPEAQVIGTSLPLRVGP